MNTIDLPAAIAPELRSELQQALVDAARGVRDPEKMKSAAERMDRMREENRRLFGDGDIGVEIIRSIRDNQ